MPNAISSLANLLSKTPLYPYWLFFKAEKFDNELCFKNHANGIIIDIGCGSANYMEYCQKLPNVTNYIGIDYPDWLTHLNQAEVVANSKGEFMATLYRSSPNKARIFADGTNLAIKSNSVDTVLSLGVLEHVPEANKYLNEAFRVLKPGGKLIITIPFLYQAHGGPDATHDYYRWTREGIKYDLVKSGFTIIEAKGFGKTGTSFANLINSFAIKKMGANNNIDIFFFLKLPLLILIFSITNILGYFLEMIDDDHAYASGFRVVGLK